MKKIFNVYLRAFEPDDYLKIHAWRQDEEIARNFGGVKLFSSTLNEKKWVEDRIFDKVNVSCAVCIKETDEFIGCVFLNDIDNHNRSGHCPVFIGVKEHWGKGFATDARMLILKYAFLDRGLERIWALVMEDNIGALRMLEKCGYKKEGLLRGSAFKDGQFINQFILGVIREDFMAILNTY